MVKLRTSTKRFVDVTRAGDSQRHTLAVEEVAIPHVGDVCLDDDVRVDVDDLLEVRVDVRQLEARVIQRVDEVLRALPDLRCDAVRCDAMRTGDG
jgi:hypothetical protein